MSECKAQEDFASIELRDGRRLAFKVHGQGVPVFALHGMESDRYTFDTGKWGGKAVPEVVPGVQLIAMDRPGYGDSTPPPSGYSYVDFVADLAELADHLKHERFCVAGHSSGGPYALAAAAFLPDRVVACAAVSSDPPYVHARATEELKKLSEMNGDALVRSGYYGQSAKPSHVWQQGPLGWVCDYVLERLPWPFAPESLTLGARCSIWVGTEDVPPIKVGANFLQELIPGSVLREQKRTHGLKKDLKGQVTFQHLQEIMDELQLQWKSAPPPKPLSRAVATAARQTPELPACGNTPRQERNLR